MVLAQRMSTGRSSIWLLTLAVGLANFNDFFLFSIIVPVIPFALKQRVAVGNDDEVQRWISILLAVYGVAWFFFAPICGYIGDRAAHVRNGRRACILAGLIVLMTATTLFCIGTSIPILVVGRIVQGAATAMNQTLPRAILVQRVGVKNAGVYTGYLSFVGCAANAASFFLGGLIYQRAGYRPVWFLCFAMIGTEIAVWLAILEPPAGQRPESTDTVIEVGRERADFEHDVNVISPSMSLASLTVSDTASESSLDLEKKETAITVMEVTDHRTPDIIEHSKAGIPITAQMPNPPRRGHLPIFVRLLMSPRIIATILGTLVIQIIYAAFDAVLSQHLNHIFGWGSFACGLMMMTIYLCGFLDPLIGWICDRYGPKRVATAGLCLSTPCLIALRAVDGESTGEKVLLTFLLVSVGFTASLTIVGCSAEVAYAVKAMEVDAEVTSGEKAEHMLAQAYSLNTMAVAAACTIGPLWAGLVSNAQGWNVMTLSLGVVASVMAVPIWFLIGGKDRQRDKLSECDAV